MRSKHRKHRSVGAWVRAVIADAALTLSERRTRGEARPENTLGMVIGTVPVPLEYAACCGSVKDQNRITHAQTYSHCYAILLDTIHGVSGIKKDANGRPNPGVTEHWNDHLEQHLSEQDRAALLSAINLGALQQAPRNRADWRP